MLGFLDEIIPLLHLCCVQRDLIIGVSGNSCKSCRYFLRVVDSYLGEEVP